MNVGAPELIIVLLVLAFNIALVAGLVALVVWLVRRGR
jgi:hypothetical protein